MNMRINAALLAAGAALASGLLVIPAFAAVTPYSWIRAGEAGSSPFLDSSGNNPSHPFNAAFSSGPPPAAGGNPAVVLRPTGVGGPLGPSGIYSTASTEWGYYDFGNSGMWIQGQGGNGSQPGCNDSLWCWGADGNWVMEAWVLPIGDGASGGGTGAQIVSTGSGQFGGQPGGAAFRCQFNAGDGSITIRADAISPQ